MAAIPALRAPINDMIVDRQGKALMVHSDGVQQRWAYPVDGNELRQVNPEWSFASKSNPPKPKQDAAPQEVITPVVPATVASAPSMKPPTSEEPDTAGLSTAKQKVEPRPGAIRGGTGK